MTETTRRAAQPGAKHSAVGALPQGSGSEQEAAHAVQQMFDSVAPRYDLLNHVLSANIDRLWWWRAARTFDHILRSPDARVLDLCCGTGDMALALRRRAHSGKEPLIAVDFSHQMLRRGKQKFRGQNVIAIEADALNLPFAAGSFELVTSAFGFRNLVNYQAGLTEIFRVLRTGGEVGILDFNEPGGLFGKLYAFYFRRVLPKIGGFLSGDSAAYSYLPMSVERFPAPAQMLDQMRRAGFTDVSWTPYTFGIAGLYRGRRP